MGDRVPGEFLFVMGQRHFKVGVRSFRCANGSLNFKLEELREIISKILPCSVD